MGLTFTNGTTIGPAVEGAAFTPTAYGQSLGYNAKKGKKRSFGEATGTGILGDIAEGIVNPFIETGLDVAENVNKSQKGGANYAPQFMDQEMYDDYQKNPVLRRVQNLAGVVSPFIPGGGVAKAALAAGLQGFSSSRGTNEDGTANIGNVIGDTVKSAALGGVADKALQVGGKLLSKVGARGAEQAVEQGASKIATSEGENFLTNGAKGLRNYAEGRDLNVLKRAIGTPAPKSLGGAAFEKEIMGLADNLGFGIKSADDLLTMSDDILAKNGTKVADDAARLSAKGVKFDSDKVINKLQGMLDDAKLPSDKAQIQKVIDDVAGGLSQGDDLLSAYRLKQQIGPKGKFSQLLDPNLKPQFEAYNTAYKELNNELENQFTRNGVTDFRETNKLNELGLKARQWGDNANLKVRPTASTNDMLQDSAIAGMIATGNPIGAIPGAIGGKILQSSALESGLSKVANGAANVLDTVGGKIPLSGSIPGAATAGNLLTKIAASKAPGMLAGQAFGSQGQPVEDTAPIQPQNLPPAQIGKTKYDDILQLMKSGMSAKDAQGFLAQMNGGVAGAAKAKPLSSEERKLQSNVRAGSKALDDIESILSQDQNALMSGQLPAFIQSSNARKLSAAMGQVTDVIGRLRSGGAINKDEEEKFRSFLPGPFDDPDTKAYKINALRGILDDATSRQDMSTEVV